LVSISKHEQNVDCSYLFDTGISENGVIHNADVFRIDFSNIDGIILSHGHFDHFTGLVNILKRISSSRKTTDNIDVFAHPDAFQKRWAIFPDGKRARFPILYEQQLRQLGATIHKNIGVCNLLITKVPLLTITGEIPREIDFEKGFPINILKIQIMKEILSQIH
jgi:7,8-dihydropterin-6-yl-methyl-4-(beta-D-ribofuranosyl)aminobenzene 5'-phosphate synthase